AHIASLDAHRGLVTPTDVRVLVFLVLAFVVAAQRTVGRVSLDYISCACGLLLVKRARVLQARPRCRPRGWPHMPGWPRWLRMPGWPHGPLFPRARHNPSQADPHEVEAYWRNAPSRVDPELAQHAATKLAKRAAARLGQLLTSLKAGGGEPRRRALSSAGYTCCGEARHSGCGPARQDVGSGEARQPRSDSRRSTSAGREVAVRLGQLSPAAPRH
ncbi:hypothetical protein T492DRAFT_1075248, partial [Pavlovales sp. CCMP2436]